MPPRARSNSSGWPSGNGPCVCYPPAMARRRRKRMMAPEGIGALLARAGEDRFAPNRAPVPPHVWAAAVGGRIAERTRPVGIDRGILLVRAATSVWATELSLLSEALVARLRSAGVQLVGLRFNVGTVEPPPRDAAIRTAKVPGPTPLDAAVAQVIGSVEDDELRQAIADAARTNLAWQAFNEGDAPASARPRAARAPRVVEKGTSPPDRTTRGGSAAGRGSRGGG